jgi:hypothetical protein
MRSGGSLEWWETPLWNEGYKSYFITQGSWQNDTFVIPIDCSRDDHRAWERWLCFVKKSIWVRVASNEFYEVAMQSRLPEGPFRGPFYRILGSDYVSMYEEFLRKTGVMKGGDSLREFWIASMENEIHILSREEPSFEKIRQRY